LDLKGYFTGLFGSLLQERSGQPLADRFEMIPDRLLGPHGIARLDSVEDLFMLPLYMIDVLVKSQKSRVLSC
jgi:hypothetical protein